MANPFSKGWKYLMQSFDSKIDENADPRVQIQQAVAAAKQNHQEITQQAAAIIGNRNQLEMKIDRLVKSRDDLQTKARTALQANLFKNYFIVADFNIANQFDEIVVDEIFDISRSAIGLTLGYKSPFGPLKLNFSKTLNTNSSAFNVILGHWF